MEWLFSKLAAHESHLTILLRLVVATFAGMAIGLNRDKQNKPIGMRTLALVSLSAAAVVLTGTVYGEEQFHQDALSRVVQGVLTGVGFLGAGVIMRGKDNIEVHGLTTASTVWIAAALGVTSGLGAWFITFVGTAIALLLLSLGKQLEYSLLRLLGFSPPQNHAVSEGEPKSTGGDESHPQP